MKRMLIAFAAIAAALYFLPEDDGPDFSAYAGKADSAETFRLVHAIGNTEMESARGLSKSECEWRRDEKKQVGAAMGVGGSITCLPESLFD